MKNLKVTPGAGPSVDKLPVEIVERKGKGHPDTLADKAAEELSVRLSEYYLEIFDQVVPSLGFSHFCRGRCFKTFDEHYRDSRGCSMGVTVS